MTTIPRNHKRKIAEIKKTATLCKSYSLSTDFAGIDVSPDVAWSELERFDYARLTEDSGKWTVQVHSNLWYELRAASQAQEAEASTSAPTDAQDHTEDLEMARQYPPSKTTLQRGKWAAPQKDDGGLTLTNYEQHEIDQALRDVEDTDMVRVKFSGPHGDSRWLSLPLPIVQRFREIVGEIED